MPTTVTSTSGNTYHLFQLAEASYWEPEESIRFEELENDLGDGYFSQALYGANTGLRKWKLKLASLAHTDVLPNTVTDVSGATVSREEYLWNLFCYTKVTGEPFVFTSPRDGQYHLVRFADKDLSYQKMRVKIYSTGVELKQVRIPGESIFQLAPSGDIGIVAQYKETGHATPNWNATIDDGWGGGAMAATGDVVYGASTQNGLNIIRLNDSASTGFLTVDFPLSTLPFNDAFIVMKMRGATFSNNCGVLTGNGGNAILLGTSAGTKFQNPSLSDMQYRLNGTLYAATNMQAPMGTWGIIHLRFAASASAFDDAWQIGKNQATAGTFAKMDVGEVLFGYNSDETPMPSSITNQITEYLTTKWGIV
jgi:hypothetical protein